MTKPRLAINREGYFLLLLIVVLGGAAIYSGNNGLVLLFSILVFFFLFSIFWGRRNVRGITLTRVLPKRLQVGEEQRVRIDLYNGGEKAYYGLHIYEEFSSERVIGPIYVPCIQPEETLTTYYDCNFERRGKVRFHTMVIRSRFPSSFFEWRLPVKQIHEGIVLPQLLPYNEAEAQMWQEEGGDRRYEVDETFKVWRKGTSMRRIAWKISAKKKKWIERQPLTKHFTREWQLNLPPSPAQWDPKFERLISRKASFALYQLSLGHGVSLWQGKKQWLKADTGEKHKERLLKTLALL